MKKFIAVLIALLLLSAPVVSFAAPEGEKGASATAYEHASDQSVFNRVSDWFATVGKSDEEKERIMVERRAKRTAERAQKEAEKQAKQLEKEKAAIEKEAKKKLNQLDIGK
jgi:FKBP-type peptidyl-prolyl cis-trans isomerase